MPEFTYTARDRAGSVVEGTIEAANSALAAGRIREMGYEVERVRAVGGASARSARPERSARRDGGDPNDRGQSMGQRAKEGLIYPVVSGVVLKELAVFYRQLATMINAGIPLYQSLVTLEGQTRNPKLQEVLRNCQRQ